MKKFISLAGACAILGCSGATVDSRQVVDHDYQTELTNIESYYRGEALKSASFLENCPVEEVTISVVSRFTKRFVVKDTYYPQGTRRDLSHLLDSMYL